MAMSFILYGNIAVAFRQRFRRRTFPSAGCYADQPFPPDVGPDHFRALPVFPSHRPPLGSSREKLYLGLYRYRHSQYLPDFSNEGIYRFEIWKNNLQDAEQLKLSISKARSTGWKSQVNPHFLFNSLNSIRVLIQENTGRLKVFLNDMSKVYRYMPANEEEQLGDAGY